MAKDYTKLAADILLNVGERQNISSLTHCMTRLRMTVKDKNKVMTKELEQLEGVIQVIDAGGQIQIVIGTKVSQVYDEVVKITGVIQPEENMTEDSVKKESLVGRCINLIAGLFTPILGAFIGAGMLKVILMVLTTCGVLTTEMGTYQILYAAADAIFYFLPIALAVTAAKKFGCNQFVALVIAGALIYPDIITLYNAGTQITFLKIPVVLANYSTSVIPAIVAIWFTSVVEKSLKKILPPIFQNLFLTMLEITICVPATFLVIGPVTTYVGNALAAGYTFIMGINPVIAGVIVAFAWPCLIIFGLHWGFFPIVMNNIATMGYDTLFVITGPNNMAQAGASLGVFLKTRNKELKSEAGSCALTGVVAGVTEPAIYGVNLKYKKPFVIAMIFSGIAGGIVAYSGTHIAMLVGTSLLTLPAYMGTGFVGFLIACAVAFFGSAIATFFFGFDDTMLRKEENKHE